MWAQFREPFIQLGYLDRPLSWNIYLILILSISILYWFIIKRYKQYNPVTVAVIIGGICLVSYPFLSHDFFNYMFDARILTQYGQNPYLHTAQDFPKDDWLRFMHWVHRPYPYGPTFLPLTLIPAFLSFGKFISNYIFFKLLFTATYVVGVYFLSKKSRQSALEFATHPFVILEGLINLHNDMLAVSFIFAGVYYLSTQRVWLARFMLAMSGGIKYLTAPLFILKNEKLNRWNYAVIGLQLLLFVYLVWSKGFQQWYFFIFFALLPYFPRIIKMLSPVFLGLMVSYYPYIRLGGWDTPEKVLLKDQIIYVAIGLNIIHLCATYLFHLKKHAQKN